MTLKSLFGAALAVLAAWFALGVYTAQADDTFNGCTFYSRMKVAGSGNSTCPIVDVEYMPTGTTSIDAKYRPNSTTTSCLFCSRGSSANNGPLFTYFTSVNGSPRWDYNSTQKGGSALSTDTTYRLIIENGTAKLYTSTDRAVVSTMEQTAATFSGTYRMYLFSSYTSYANYGNGGQYYFYYLKVYDGAIADGKLLHHYVPCKTSDGTVAVADLVDEKVYTASNAASALTVADTDSVGGVRPAVSEDDFTKVATFTASGYAGSEALDDFPTLVRLSTSISGFSYDDCGENGANIRFADSDGKLLAHEIDTWNTSGESLIWVNVPKLSKTTEFKMYLGGDGSTATLPVSSIWRRAGYKFVFHNNVTATTAGADSAGSGLVGVAENNALAVSTSVEGAPLGSCDNQTGDQGWHVDNNTIWGGHGGQLSMSIWTYRTDTSDNYSRALIGSPAKYVAAIYTSSTTGHLTIGGNLDACNVALPVKSGNWMHINAVCDTKYYQFYQNGVQASGMSLTTAMADNTNAVFGVGSEKLTNRNKGYLDEARLRWDASTADWVKAEYDTVGNASFLACGGFFAVGEGPDPEDWEYSFTIALGDVLQSAIGSETLSSFPLLVRLSTNSISGFKYSDFKVENGGDLVFLDASGNFLEYEIDTWDTNGVSLVWVKIPSLTANTGLTCRYHGPEYSHTPSKTWSNYVGVWHMNEESGTAVDATGHGLDGTPTGTSAASVMVGTAGVVGKSRINQAQTGKINGMLIPNYNSHITTASKFSVGGWYKATGGNGYARPMSRKTSYGDNTGFEIEFTDGSVTDAKICGSSGTQVAYKMPNMTQGWCNLLYVFDGATVTVYTNGYMSVSGTITAVVARDAGLMFGNNLNCAEAGWYGMYDELRFYDGVLSAARVRFDHLVQSEDSALDLGSVQTPDPELPRLKYCEAVAISNGNIVVSGSVLRHSGVVTVTLTAEGRKSIVVDLGEIAADGDFERELTDDDGLVKFVTYNVSIACANGEKKAELQLADPVKFGKVDLTDFNYRFDVTVTNGFTEAALTNFPLLVRLSTAIEGFDYGQFQRGGEDLMVFDADGNPLPYELENFDTEGESRLWVQVPVVTNGVKLAVGYGVSEAVETKAMWTEYASVLHLNTDAVPDSTGNATPTANAVSVSAAGILGSGRSMGTTTGTSGACVTVPVSDKLDECNGVFTASAWTKLNASPYWGYLMSRKIYDSTAAWGLQFRGSEGNASVLSFALKASKDGADSVKFSDLTQFAVGTWVKWTAVYNGTELSLYLDGTKIGTQTSSYGEAVNGTYALGIGGFADSTGHATLPAVFDEARVKVGAVGADWVAAEYKQELNLLPLEYGAVGPADPSAPVVEQPVVTPNGDGTFTVAVTITGNMPKEDSVKLVYNGTVTVLTTTDTSVPAHYSYTLTPAAENATGQITIKAKSTIGSLRTRTVNFYNGELAIEKIRDASEKGLSNGIWRITRADTNLVLAVALDRLASSTAVAGTDYYDFELEAAIPDGTNSVDVLLAPKMNLERSEDTWVDLAISNGAYRIDSAKGSARVTIKNYEVPSGGNIWCATAAGKASVGSNWTSGVAPDENTAVVFDGDVSTADCEWDIDAAHTVKAWSQNSKYTGTVTIDTKYPVTGSDFQTLRITGDCDLLGGAWTHPIAVDLDNSGKKLTIAELRAKYQYRLCVQVDGDMTVGPSAKIDAKAKGHSQKRLTGNVVSLTTAHGGQFPDSSVKCYGNPKYPEDVGYASNAGTDSLGKCAAGGGAVKLTVGGDLTLCGEVSVDGEAASGNIGASSAGSILVEARNILGYGKLHADGVSCGNGSYNNGCGGRIALIASGTLDRSRLTVSAGASESSGKLGGAGTIYFKDSGSDNGTLCLNNPFTASVNAKPDRGAVVTAEGDWTFDAVELNGNVNLWVVDGVQLNLVNGFASVTAPQNSVRCSGIYYKGGTLSVGDGDQTISGNWYFCPMSEFEFPADLTVTGGGAVGFSTYWECSALANQAYPTDPWTVRFAVRGDMTVDSDGTITAYSAGQCQQGGQQPSGMSIGNHGGRIYENGTTTDSVFRPRLGCLYQSNSYNFVKGAGVIDFSVDGNLTVDGIVNAKGMSSTDGQKKLGGAGSINIVAGTISGKGSILASATEVSQAGGRVAVRLTGEDADFSKFTGKILARGGGDASTSSGSVYLQTGADREKGGTVTFENNDREGFYTPVCATGYGADAYGDFADAVLELKNMGRVQLSTDDGAGNFAMRSLIVSGQSLLDLAGMAFTVRTATVNGSKVPVGTYEAGDDPFGDLLEDSAGGGSLRVTGYGIWVFIQ